MSRVELFLVKIIPWWGASLLANVSIMFVEYYNRVSPGGWASALPYTITPIVIAQWCLWRSFSGGPHWMTAWAVFTLGNAVMRLVAVAAFGPDKVGNWYLTSAGVAIMIIGSLTLKRGLA